MTARRPWIQVGETGKAVELPTSGPISLSHIELEDLIPALSRQCRFNGHCNVFYSVLEHMCLVSALAPIHLKREALLHDLAESLTGDVISPLKRAHGAGPIFARIENAVARRFIFQWPVAKEVKSADLWALRIEYHHLLPHTRSWETLDMDLPTAVPKCLHGYLGRSSEQAQNLFWDMWISPPERV